MIVQGIFCARANFRRKKKSSIFQGFRPVFAVLAAAFLLVSCEPPVSAPPKATSETPTNKTPTVSNSAIPNLQQIQQRLNIQYFASAKNTEGVDFTLKTSGNTVNATITYDDKKLLPMKVGNTTHQI